MADELKCFMDSVPTLGMLGTQHKIDDQAAYSVDSDVQLVCKYLQAYKSRKIDKLYPIHLPKSGKNSFFL